MLAIYSNLYLGEVNVPEKNYEYKYIRTEGYIGIPSYDSVYLSIRMSDSRIHGYSS
jgi:hypothetical protein